MAICEVSFRSTQTFSLLRNGVSNHIISFVLHVLVRFAKLEMIENLYFGLLTMTKL